ncbi:MAG TPA: serine/threonine-protein kinase, partial [Thermoanaerobaculia bacterium]|nr:serine/threonine-protein kinase [Thermoanaerobaculia bacterium]
MEKPSSGSLREPADTPADTPADGSGETQLAIPAPQAEAVARRAQAAIPSAAAIPPAALAAHTALEDSARPSSSSGEADPMIGRTVDHYTIHSHLGGGGMGVVYKAEDSRLQRTLALKFLPSSLTRDAVAKSRFLQEARAASALDHPNVCTIYDIGETDDGRLYLAMPAYDGETLKKKIERGPLPVDEAVGYATQIAQGLAKAHRQGIVHRDIKPANLMVTSDGIVKIL